MEGEEKGPLRALVCTGDCPTPTPPASVATENRICPDTNLHLWGLETTATSAACAQGLGGGAAEAECAGVRQPARQGPRRGAVSSPATTTDTGPGKRASGIEGSWTSPRVAGRRVQTL